MRVKHRFAALLALTLAGTSMPSYAAPSDDFATLARDHWAWVLRENPVLATTLGVRDYDQEIGDPSLAAQDRSAAEAQRLLDRLDAIPLAQLTPAQRTDAAILKRDLAGQVAGNRFGQRTALFTTYSGWHQNFAGMADSLSFRTQADFRSYLDRLNKYPGYNDAALAVSDAAIAQGYTLPCAVLGNTEKSITGVIQTDPIKSRFYQPFTSERPRDISASDWVRLQAEARELITAKLNPAYAKHADWYRTRYAPKCRDTVGISATKDGRDFYNYRVGQQTTTTMTADQVHALGLSEVARIRTEMTDVATKAGYPTREAFIAELRSNPKYFAKSPEELMEAVARMTKTIDGKMPSLFRRLPRLPYGIREIPAEIAEGTTTAYYSPGSPEGGLSGTYYVNTSKLDQRPLWEVPALTVHEAVPGHHHQIALQQELDLSDYRKHAAFFTAFVEGWGLYSERLGIEMGLYDTPQKDMGRLSYEMWRASRLVVDTGIHAKGWSKDRAVQFMQDNTALTDANIDAEVNRYISWPGQALAYKIGELKIRELRTLAERELGDRFDLRDFHDAVLGQGAVPLDLLETQVKAWIKTAKLAPVAVRSSPKP